MAWKLLRKLPELPLPAILKLKNRKDGKGAIWAVLHYTSGNPSPTGGNFEEEMRKLERRWAQFEEKFEGHFSRENLKWISKGFERDLAPRSPRFARLARFL